MTTRTIYLVRHGQYDTNGSNSKNSLGGSLTEKGRQQAIFVAEYFSELPIKKIFASTLTRATETAQIVAEKLKMDLEVSDLLQEVIPSIPTNTNGAIAAVLQVGLQLSHTTIEEHMKKSENAFNTFFNPPAKGVESYKDIIVCHGNIIRYFLCKVLNVDINNWIKFDINHCGICCVAIEDSGFMRVLSHNETKHLPSALISA